LNRINFNNVPIKNNNISSIKRPAKVHRSFQEVLDTINKNDSVKFSKHALERLESRNINLTNSEIDKINSAITKASQKGVKEALILMDNKAFIASVKNNTVITAAIDNQLKDSVFTNIDGAVII